MSVPPLSARREAEVRRWLRYAREELDAAHREGEHIHRLACYLAQQAAEKAIKAVLMHEGITFEWGKQGHDLDALRQKLPSAWAVTRQPPSLAGLTIWASEARYPGNLPEAIERDVDEAIRAAEEVYNSVADDLTARGVPVP